MMTQKTKLKDSYKYNKDGFININGYLTKLDKNWRRKEFFVIMNAPRNIGKSYGTWDMIENDYWKASNYTDRIVYARTNKEKLKKAIEDFNSKYRGKYYMNETKIYKQTFDEFNKEILKERIEIGAVMCINQAENYKSLHFENYKLVFWDEYNEFSTHRGQWMKVIDSFKTIKRFNKEILFFLVGNKVNANNEILNKLQISLKDIQDKEQDYAIEVMKDVWFIEIGNSTFSFANSSEDIVNRLATLDDETDAYLNNGLYLLDEDDSVIIYDRYVKDTKKIITHFTCEEYKFEFGSFIMDDEKHYYFRQIKNVPEGAFAYALNIIGEMRVKTSGLMDKKSLVDWADDLKQKSKRKKLWYCSYDAKLTLEPLIRHYCNWD